MLSGLASSQPGQTSLINKWCICGCWFAQALSFGHVMDPNGSLVLDCFAQITAHARFQKIGTGIEPGTTLLLKPELKQDHGNNFLLETESTLDQGCK